MRKVVDSRAPPLEPQTRKQASFQGADVSVAVKASKALRGIREILTPRQAAANLFSGSFTQGAIVFPTFHAIRDAEASRSLLGATGPHPSASRGC